MVGEHREGGRIDPRPPDFVIRSEQAGSAWLVSVEGELDLATAPQLERDLQLSEAREATAVIVDLSAVSFIDSSGLRALIQAADRLAQTGRDLHVACPPGPARRLFELTAVASVFSIHDDRSAAIAASSTGKK